MMSDIIREEARLRILEALNEQPDRRWNSAALAEDLKQRWAITRSQDWVAGELAWLDGMGLVATTLAAKVIIAELTARGLDHIEGRALAHGVKRPDPKV